MKRPTAIVAIVGVLAIVFLAVQYVNSTPTELAVCRDMIPRDYDTSIGFSWAKNGDVSLKLGQGSEAKMTPEQIEIIEQVKQCVVAAGHRINIEDLRRTLPRREALVEYDDRTRSLRLFLRPGVKLKYDDRPTVEEPTGSVYDFGNIGVRVQWQGHGGTLFSRHWLDMSAKWTKRPIAHCVTAQQYIHLDYKPLHNCVEADPSTNCLLVSCTTD